LRCCSRHPKRGLGLTLSRSLWMCLLSVTVELLDGSYSVSMTLKKAAQPGTVSMWYSLMQGEAPATCMKYRGRTSRYHWSQNLDYMNAYIPIPQGTSRTHARPEVVVFSLF
jgi:hypothetical protein